MCCCFHSFKDLWLYLSAIHSGPVTRVSKRIAKVRAFINSVQIFLSFSEDYSPQRLPENLSKNYTFLKRAAKVGIFAYSTKSFFQIPFLHCTLFCLKNNRALKSGRQRYNEYFYHQSFSLKNFPFPALRKGLCFKTGGKDKLVANCCQIFLVRSYSHSSENPVLAGV